MKKSFLMAVVAGFFLIGGGAAAYLTFFQKTPEEIWKSALDNTAKSLDKFVDLSVKTNEGSTIEGEFDLTKPAAFGIDFKGQTTKEGNGEYSLGLDVNGVKMSAEARAINAEGENPELYLRLKDVDVLGPVLSLYAGIPAEQVSPLIDAINNQWYVLDDSLLSGFTSIQVAPTDTLSMDISDEELKEVTESIANVIKDTLLSTEENKAVFVLEENIGKEKFEDTDSYKFKVKISKDGLKNFVQELVNAVEGTVVEQAMMSGQTEDSFSDLLDIESLLKEIDESEDMDDVYAHVWTEAGGAFVRNIRIYPFESGEGSEYIDFGLDYQGGDVLPFLLKIVQDSDENKGSIAFGLEFNQETAESKLTLDIDIESDSMEVVGEGSFSVAWTDGGVNVEKPEGAKSATELMTLLFGGSLDTLSPLGTSPTITPSLYDDFEL